MKVKNNKYQKMKTEQRRKDKLKGNKNNGRPEPLNFSKKEYEEFRKKNGLPILNTNKAKKKIKTKKDNSKPDTKVLFEENDDYGETQEISFDADLFNTKINKKSKQTIFSPVNGKDLTDHSESNIDVQNKKSKNKNNKPKLGNNLDGNNKISNLSEENSDINFKNDNASVNKKASKRKLENKSLVLQNNDSEYELNDTETQYSTESKKSKVSSESEPQESVPILNKLQQRMMLRFQQQLTSDKNNKYDKIKVEKREKTKTNKQYKTKVVKQDKNKNKPVQNKRIIFDDDSESFPRNKAVQNGDNIQNKKIIFDDDSKTTSTNKVDNKPALSLVKPPKKNSKKEKLKKLLEKVNVVKPASDAGSKLRQRMMERLKAAQFRYLNEKLYTSTGSEAQVLFRSDPEAFTTYHEGYKLQVTKWPMNPLDVIVNKILKMPKSHIIADMGCGEAALSTRVPHTVHSLDLVATATHVTACDMANTPLNSQSVDVAVYCLSLMGTELNKYLKEANRVLKTGGRLMIAEVESRFEDVNAFTRDVERLGFRLKTLDQKHQVFFFLDFNKIRDAPVKVNKLPEITLKPCLYKRR